MSRSETLVIFDYSGTLSLEAPRFGRPERLGQALADSGLALLGLAKPEDFWEKIVNPTWEEGSTTSIGYKRLLAERITVLRLAPGVPEQEIAAAAGRFVADYLSHSRIDPQWREPLQRLCSIPSVQTVVATDHYAEATAAITADLKALGLSCFVANSADLGVRKGDRRFWEKLREHLPLEAIRQVLTVDDFGCNEAPGDAYAAAGEVVARQAKTLACLQEVFLDSEVTAIPFFLESTAADQGAAATRLIAGTMARIEALLKTAAPVTLGCRPEIQYPCPWGYKVIGRSPEDLTQAVTEVLAGCAFSVTPSHTSKGGSYHCLNVETIVASEPQRLDLYERLRRHPAIRMVL